MKELPSSEQLLALFQSEAYASLIQHQESLAAASRYSDLMVVAGARFKLGSYQDAFTILTEIEPFLAGNPAYLSLFGVTCRHLGRLDKALTLLQQALELDPLSIAYRNNYANLLIDLKRYDDSEQILNDILAQAPDYADAISNLRRLQSERSTYQRRQPDSREAVGQQPPWSPEDPLVLAFSHQEAVLLPTAAAPAKPPVVSQPSHADDQQPDLPGGIPAPSRSSVASDQLRIAQLAVGKKQYSLALRLLSEAHGTYHLPQAVAYATASDAYIGLGDYAQAELLLLHSAIVLPPTASAYINLVSLACVRGDHVLASYYLSRLAELDPANPRLPTLRQQIDQVSASGGYAFDLDVPPAQASPVTTPAAANSAPRG